MPESFLSTLTQLTPHGVWEWFVGPPLKVVVTLLAAVLHG